MLQFALQRVQLPSGEAPDLVEGLGYSESEQELAQVVGRGGRHAFGVVVFMELPQSFVAELGKAHLALLIVSVCTVMPYTSTGLRKAGL